MTHPFNISRFERRQTHLATWHRTPPPLLAPWPVRAAFWLWDLLVAPLEDR